MTLVAMAFQFDYNGRATSLAAVCDKMLSSDSASVNLPYSKIVRWGDTWLLGYSGDPGVFAEIRLETEAQGGIEGLTAAQAAARFKDSYKKVRLREVEDNILAALGLNLMSFYGGGLASLGPEKFHALCESIEDFSLNLALLLGGWSGVGDQSAIYKIDNPGKIHDALIVGFEAIGSGSPIALGHLYDRYMHLSMPPEAMARMAEAKFMSESQRNVGRETILVSLSPNGTLQSATSESVEAYRASWEQVQAALPPQRVALLQVSEIARL